MLVSLTEAGARALDEFRAGYRAVMREQLAAMCDDAITPCTPPPKALGVLNQTLRREDPR